MHLNNLSIIGLRNLNEATISLSPRYNLFYGKNGSGKTSLLEAFYLLMSGRSFRAMRAEEFIAYPSSSCILSGQLRSTGEEGGSLRVGIMRDRVGGLVMRVDEKTCSTRAELAKILPIQIMNTDGYQLLHLPSQKRREFLDWGVFHVEHSFFSLWQRYARALKQRNAALKKVRQVGERAVFVWDAELIEIGEAIDGHRQCFLDAFVPFFNNYLQDFLKIDCCKLEYKRGWDTAKSLENALFESRNRDLALGYTSAGAHRADIKFCLNNTPVQTMFSRGQLKLFISALMLARSAWLLANTGRRSVFLLDDLHSELDKGASFLLLEGLKRMGGQVWLTAIEKEQTAELLQDEDFKMFHVEHGKIREEACSFAA
jgi:DNA replication and repair protein RecF